MPRRLAREWYSVLTILVVAIGLAASGIAYTNYVQREADRRWCPLLIIADRPNPNRPPQSPDELEARRVLHKLRLDLGCR